MIKLGRGILRAASPHANEAIGQELQNLRSQFTTLEEFKALSPLPEDAQRVVDDGIDRVGRERLTIVDDLLSEGLVTPLPNWLSVMELGWDSMNDVGHATRSMHFDVRGERQVPDIARNTIPIFGTWDDFQFEYRTLAVAERVGMPLEADSVEQATRNVNEAFEDQAINGLGYNVNGKSAPGILTNPINTVTYSAWTGLTGEQILDEITDMVAALQANNFNGPYNLYVPNLYALHISTTDFKANSSDTIQARIEALQFGGRGIRIRVADKLPANRTILMQMTRNVIDVIVGQQPTSLAWRSSLHPLAGTNFMVIGCLITRVKSNYNSESGIVVGNV